MARRLGCLRLKPSDGCFDDAKGWIEVALVATDISLGWWETSTKLIDLSGAAFRSVEKWGRLACEKPIDVIRDTRGCLLNRGSGSVGATCMKVESWIDLNVCAVPADTMERSDCRTVFILMCNQRRW